MWQLQSKLKEKNSFRNFLSQKAFGVVFLSTLSLINFIGCQKSGRGSSPAPAPIICPAGQSMTPSGVCAINQIIPVNTQMMYYSSKNDSLSTTDTFVTDESYSEFLKKSLGVCERCSNSEGEILQCSTWENGFNLLKLEFVPNLTNQVRVHFFTAPIVKNPYFQYAWSFPDIDDFFVTLFTGAPMPSCNYGQYTPYWSNTFNVEGSSTSSGFTVYGKAPFWSQMNRYDLRIKIEDGKVGDSFFNWKMTAITDKNVIINLAHGKLQKCQRPNCGL
jgi:hypothetical protein